MTSTTPFQPGAMVAFYGRDSGGDTQELSVSQQESAFRTWCSQNGLIPGSIFKDIARPGSSVIGRVSFQDMIHYFRSGQVQEVGLVIWSYSRFAREFVDSQFYRADLRRRGFIFYSLNDDVPEGPIGKLFEAIIDWKNEQFLLDLSKDTKRGLHDLVQNYGAVPGVPPRGFKRQPVIVGKRRNGQDRIAHRWVPDPDVLPHVRQAFEMRSSGKSLIEIHNATHLCGSINSYTTFFLNKLYIGILEFGDQVIENYCEPLIDRVTWDAVQQLIQIYARRQNLSGPDGNPHHPRRINSSYLLSGLVYCARCGSPLFGAPAGQRKRKDGSPSMYERYACARAYRRRDCDQGQFPRQILEDAVIATLENYVLLPDVLAEMQRQIQTARTTLLAGLEEKRIEMKNLLRGVRKRISNLTDAIAESGHTRALLEKLANLESEETGLLSQLAELERQASAPAPDLSGSQIDQALRGLRAILASGDFKAIQEMLRGFIARITIDRDGKKVIGTIAYYYPPIMDMPRSLPGDDSTKIQI